jgi:hypothetical protein
MFKRRTPDAILLTVPHSGTTFTRTLLRKAYILSDPHAKAYVPDAHWLDEIVTETWDKIVQTKLIITARDPYLSAIRSIKTKQENPIELIADAWDVCFKAMKESKESNYFVFDIECQEEDRLKHALDVIRFVGIVDAIQCRQDIIPYVEKWLPVNESHSEYKTNYLELGKLPNGYDWNLLDNAVEWYKSLTTHA